ncbi:hypothetical protein COX00_01005 [Candidatus Uhrbacteria bacterium CG22_combo_CG10-13_8_21_14_all_47_17]|uniref:Methyltransferase type 12 domain-containing protein n=1 Tax=Candidatus Uhrbacteria bacterium CG22_combo_CG10-13_8_21_14_all_47_17 TaxID=1975041 RepID=A0A2H0BUX2_9BACT|nr:MAG: hypothetical protein COX00_01005 [Candidatus Uhrbacteria bacterium CG22_combo_CG10-13_8_21_14_all_47_17]
MKPLYTKGNAAKQWIFEELHEQFGDREGSVLDLCCGCGEIWQGFLEAHPRLTYHGIDFDRSAIVKAKKIFERFGKRVTFSFEDAQKTGQERADVVTAFSAIEHVYDREAFLKTVHTSLVSGGKAYLNYDVGHFRSHNLKERLMVPVSQFLAFIGIQGPYMKRVDDERFQRQAEQVGFKVIELRKHNMGALKGFMRGASDEAVQVWYDFEQQMGKLYTPKELDPLFLSTTIVLEKL